MAPAFSKLSVPLRQLLWGLLILSSLMLLVQVCEAEKPPKVLCGNALDLMLFSVCKNGFNKKDLDGSLRRLRSRRHADLFLLPLQFKKQFEREASTALGKGKRRPSLKQMLKEEARWRRKHRITGKRLRRQATRSTGIADECCNFGCAYSDIARYCSGLV
ncbi:probable insulin-like peptide 4 [Zeugodacus cucurbitae]|uniref:Probable insulin-like peptide 4 n=1 Tax=Zeugodacus cucurbitae TaxID=28588 RepID=A0A0A1XSP1_ZEUCU|nr:probable insulin-like peptide 4 [Zeugodacus cucurbitae]